MRTGEVPGRIQRLKAVEDDILARPEYVNDLFVL
jgi:hypothetical protein